MIKRLSAGLMAAIMLFASVGMAVPDGVSRVSEEAVAHFVDYDHPVPKPCRKGVLPGAVTICQLTYVGATGLPFTDVIAFRAAETHMISWPISEAVLCAQCGRSSPYRPPALPV